MTGIALALTEVPLDARERYPERVYTREGQPELQFHWWQAPTLLPVQWRGAFVLMRWGSKDRRGRLPFGGWVSVNEMETGTLGNATPEEAVVPANLGFHRGVWFLVEEGYRAVVLPKIPGGPVVYSLTEPATNYWRNMTEQSNMMPVLVNQTI